MATEMQKNHFWTDEETIFMLQRLQDLGISKFMDGRRTRNAALFQKVAKQLKTAGFIRTSEQIRIRWKHVKQSYYAAKKNPQASVVYRPYSHILEELLGSKPSPQAEDPGVDIGLSSESVAGVEEDLVEIKVGEQSPEGSSETDEEDSVSFPRFSEASDRERSSTPPPERPPSIPPIDLPGTRSQQSGSSRRRRVPDFELVFQRMEEMNDSWRRQLQQSDERMERLVNSIIQSNATIVSALLENIRSLRPAVAPQPAMPVKHEEHD